jgi:hypothetical protein
MMLNLRLIPLLYSFSLIICANAMAEGVSSGGALSIKDIEKLKQLPKSKTPLTTDNTTVTDNTKIDNTPAKPLPITPSGPLSIKDIKKLQNNDPKPSTSASTPPASISQNIVEKKPNAKSPDAQTENSTKEQPHDLPTTENTKEPSQPKKAQQTEAEPSFTNGELGRLIKYGGSEYVMSGWSGSILFDEEQIRSFRTAIDAYTSLKNAGSDNAGTVRAANSLLDIAKPTSSPSFFLQSIIYIDKDTWTISLNNRFINNQSNNIISGIEVLSVDNDTVKLQFRTKFLDAVSPEWRSNLKFDQHLGYHNDDNSIVVNKDGDIVIFKLHQYQTLVLHDMEIRVGFVPDQPLINIGTQQTKQH